MAFRNSTLRLFTYIAMLLGIVGLCGNVAFSQNSKSSKFADFSAVASDPDGDVIPNTRIVFQGKQTIVANTGGDGTVRVQLPYGHYSITARGAGFKTKKITSLAIRVPKPPKLKIILYFDESYCDDCFVYPEVRVQPIPSDLPDRIPLPAAKKHTKLKGPSVSIPAVVP